MPSILSTSNSMGMPCVSQPKLRGTWKPVWWAKRVRTSLIVPARMWP